MSRNASRAKTLRTSRAKPLKASARLREGGPVGQKRKLSIAVSPDDVVWVNAEAARRNVSVSSIFAEAIERLRRRQAWAEYLEEAGDDDITERDMEKLRRELRDAGLRV